MNWRDEYEKKLCTPEEAVKIVRDGDVVHIGTASSVAYVLGEALYGRKDELHDVTISSAMTTWMLPLYSEDAKGHFSVLSYFVGPAERAAFQCGNAKYSSLHLSQIDKWCEETGKPTVAFIEVSPPDDFGYMSYGAYGTSMHDAVRKQASHVVLQVNKQAPYVNGMDNVVHVSQADCIVETDVPLSVVPDAEFNDEMKKISEYIVEEIDDGATIQLGLGGISGAIGYALENKNDLGIHTEMLTNSMMHLIKKGVITNKYKTFMPGRTVAAFALGSNELYQFVNRNPEIIFAPFPFVNNPYNIAKNDNMVSVNTAMAVDLYGQVAADNLGGYQQSAVGGQVDYVRGAQMAKNGKAFIALTSTLNKKGGRSSRIVSSFPPGTAVTTSRQDIQYVATEYGSVNLKPLSMGDRARALISIAHPDFRDQLTEEAKQIGLI